MTESLVARAQQAGDLVVDRARKDVILAPVRVILDKEREQLGQGELELSFIRPE